MTNLVQFPGLGLSFELSRVAFSIGDMDIYLSLIHISEPTRPY